MRIGPHKHFCMPLHADFSAFSTHESTCPVDTPLLRTSKNEITTILTRRGSWSGHGAASSVSALLLIPKEVGFVVFVFCLDLLEYVDLGVHVVLEQ